MLELPARLDAMGERSTDEFGNFFARFDAAYLHVRSATAGCFTFAARVRPAP